MSLLVISSTVFAKDVTSNFECRVTSTREYPFGIKDNCTVRDQDLKQFTITNTNQQSEFEICGKRGALSIYELDSSNIQANLKFNGLRSSAEFSNGSKVILSVETMAPTFDGEMGRYFPFFISVKCDKR